MKRINRRHSPVHWAERTFAAALRLVRPALAPDFERDSREFFRDRVRAASSDGALAVVPILVRALADILIIAIHSWTVRPFMRHRLSDVRHAVRSLLAQPAPTTMAVAILALGLGTCAAMYSVVTEVLLRPLSYPQAEQLLSLDLRTDMDTQSLSRPEVATLRSALSTIQAIGGADYQDVFLAGGTEPRWTAAAQVTHDVFTTLGVPPLVGRVLHEQDGTPAEQNVVISHRLWTTEFGGDPTAVGRVVSIDGRAHRVVGVMPASFQLPWDLGLESPSDIWMPLVARVEDPRVARDLDVIARLAPGVSLLEARAELDRVSMDFGQRFPADYPRDRHWSFSARAILEGVTVQHRRALIVLFAATGCLLMLVVVNVSGLTLSRLAMRAYEMDVRAAIGASLTNLRTQLMAESLLVALAGGVGGLGLAKVMLAIALPLVPQHIPRLADVGIGLATVTVTLVLSVCIGVLVGVSTLWRLKSTGVPVAGRAVRRTLAGLLAFEVAASVVLLVAAGLMVRTMARLNDVPTGFVASGAMAMRLALPRVAYPDAHALERFFAEAVEAVRATPGVEAAGAVRRLPFATQIGRWTLRTSRDQTDSVQAHFQVVTPGYFEALRIPTRAGRVPGVDDRRAAPGVVVISESMARQFWPGRDPVGQDIRMDGHPGNPWIRIVGVVADTRHNGLTENPVPTVYLPFNQAVTSAGPFMETSTMQLVVRSAGPREVVEPIVRARLRAIDPALPIGAAQPIEDILTASTSERRFLMWLLGTFSGLAVALVALGIHGVLTLVVRQREPEIAVRVAIGASPAAVVRLVTQRLFVLAVVGAGAGSLAALAAGASVSSFLFGVTARDPLTFATVLCVVALALVAGGLAPLRRALALETVTILRQR